MSKAATRDRKTATKRRPVASAPAVIEAPAQIEQMAPVCVHRWVIESSESETSHGTCRVCGAEKEFPNAAEDGLWQRNVPQSRWTGRTEWKPPSGSGY
jgi:hypothetical protein